MKDRITLPGKVHHVEGDFPVQYVYTAGKAGEEFGKILRSRGILMGSHCGSCDLTYLPPRTYCERCFERLKLDTKVGPGGELLSFSESYLTKTDERRADPELWGLIRLDGADTAIVHHLSGNRKKLRIGARVRAKLRPKGKREGLLTDIESFTL